MPMTKKHFIQIADALRRTRPSPGLLAPVHMEQWEAQVQATADTLAASNPAFLRARWLDYIHGRSTANGKPVRKDAR